MNQPKLTKFESTIEQNTMLSNYQRWLFNTHQNSYQILDSAGVRGALEEHWEDEEKLFYAISEQINQLDQVPGADPKKKTLAILAAGPSLKRYAKFLPWVFKHCYTITSPTVLPYLSTLGLYPDVVIAVDAHPILGDYTRSSGAHEKSNLICCLEVNPRMPLLFGPDRTFWFRTVIPGPQGQLDWEPYSMFMTFLMNTVKYGISQAGCVTNMALYVGDALRQGAGWEWDRILLLGADFAFVDDEMRVPTVGEDGVPEDHVKGDLTDKALYRGPGAPPEGMKSNGRMIRYKAGTMFIWMENNFKIYTMSHGILTEFPQVTEKQVRADDWPEYLSEHKIKQRATNYLAWFQQLQKRLQKKAEEAQNGKIEIATNQDISKVEASRNRR